MYKSSLNIKNFITNINIGISAKDRISKQKVVWNLSIFDEKFSHSCYTDEVKHTVCFSDLRDIIKDAAENTDCKLLEHLCYKVYIKLKDQIKKKIKLEALRPKCSIDSQIEEISYIIEDQ